MREARQKSVPSRVIIPQRVEATYRAALAACRLTARDWSGERVCLAIYADQGESYIGCVTIGATGTMALVRSDLGIPTKLRRTLEDLCREHNRRMTEGC